MPEEMLPTWEKLGAFGIAVVWLLVALRWMTGRTEKSEKEYIELLKAQVVEKEQEITGLKAAYKEVLAKYEEELKADRADRADRDQDKRLRK